MFYKMCCLFVIGLVVALSRQVEANDPYEVPQSVIAQLHYVVRSMRIWVDDNRDVDSDDFKNHFNLLGYQVSRILSLTPPEHVDYCLWQLNMLANQIEIYFRIRYENDVPGQVPVTNTINDQLYNFLQMIETRLHTMLGFYQNIRGSISRIVSKSKYSNKSQELLNTVIPAELNKLDQYISAKINENAAQADISMYHPSNLYLNDIVASPANLQLMSDSLLVQWDTESVQYELDIKYKTAVYEFGDTNGIYTHILSLRYFVYVKTILVSVVAHLDVHFNAYRLFAQRTGETGNDVVWDSVVGLMKRFIRFYKRVYGDSVVSEVYEELRRAGDVSNPSTLVTSCIDASELLQSTLQDHSSEMSSTSSDPRTKEVLLTKQAEGLSPNDVTKRLMLIVELNYYHLNIYINKLHEQFKNVDSRKFEYFLNMFKQID